MATIRQKGPYQWHVQIRRKGWPHQTATLRTRKDAEAWARKLESEMDRSQFVDQSMGRQTTLGDLIAIYLKDVSAQRVGEASRVAETARLERFLRDEKALCSHAVVNLKPEHFEDYRDRRLSQPASANSKRTIAPGTVRRELTLLKRAIDYRKRRLGLTVNPVNTEDVARPVVNDERDVRLSVDERGQLLDACSEARNPWLRPFVELGFETGARRGSLLRLRWEDIDLQKRTALLRSVKNSRNPGEIVNHTIGLSPRAIAVLQDLPRNNGGQVFPISANAFRLAFNRAREKAGLTHFRFHDTRHERTASLFEGGWNLIQVMAQTGHKDPKSVKRYATLAKEYLAEELAKLEEKKG